MSDLAVTGPTLRVRIPHEDDAAGLYRHASDREVTKWFSWGPYNSESEARSYLARLPAQRARGEQLDLVVEHLEAGPIGVSGLSEFAPRDRRATLGTWLGREWWGTGANRECKALMCHVAFDVLGLERLGAYANVDHGRSQRALERVGFEREGILRGFHRHGERSLDVAIFSLLREDWLASELREVPIAVEGSAPAAFVVVF
ncbi:MAG TPA: GNAT family N-acetyltransferase [Solirubrobacteraceae bacterium]|nr:GNAT family N-acetyltransferase [Solirubrobacteraceae bacterium]